MPIRYAALTRRGKSRGENQDCVAIAGRVLSDGMLEGTESGGLLAVVCDGVGGGPLGAKAAALACDNFRKIADVDNPSLSIFKQMESAERALHAGGAESASGSRLAAAIAGVYIGEGECIAFNAGDARVYELASDGELCQLSDDHTRAQAMVDAMFARTATELPSRTRSTLIRYLGDGRCRPAFTMRSVGKGCVRYAICSDGVHHALSDQGLREALCGEQDLRACCMAACDAAVNAGAEDDISVVVLECE